MFYVLIRLNDYLQVARISPSLLQETRRLLVLGMEAGKCRLQKEHAGAFLFLAGSEYTAEPAAALRTTMHVYEQLRQLRDQLYGFSVCFDLANTDDIDRLFRSMNALLLSMPDEDSFWIGERVAPLVTVLELEQRGENFRVTGNRRQTEQAFEGLSSFARLLPVRKDLSAALESHLFSRESRGSLLVTGSAEHALLRHTVIELEELVGKDHGWVIVPENRGYRNPGIPLLHSMDRRRMEETPGFLVRSERLLWKRLLPIVDFLSDSPRVRPIPDRMDRDLSFLFLLYLTGFRRRMEAQLLPPVILLHRPHRYGREFLSHLSRIISDVSKGGKIVPVIVEEKPWYPSQQRFPISRRVKVELPAPEWILELLSKVDRVEELDFNGICRLTGRKTVPLFVLLSLLRNGSGWSEDLAGTIREGDERSANALYPALLKRLTEREQDYLCIASAAAGILRPEEALRIVEPGLDTADLHGFFRTLSSIGLTAPENGSECFTDNAHRLAERFLPDRLLSARHRIAGLLLELRHRRRFREDRGLLSLLSVIREPNAFLAPARSFVRDLLNRGETGEAVRFCGPAPPVRGLSQEDREAWQRIRRAGLFRAALIRGDERRARMYARSAATASGEDRSEDDPDIQLQLGTFLRKLRSGRDAMGRVKKALIGFQELQDIEGECQASIQLGLLLLNEGKVLEAADYFAICRKSAEAGNLLFEQIVATSLESVSLFVYGNYTRSLRLVRSARSAADKAALREWELFSMLLEGRIYFELGQYPAARTLFLRGRSTARVFGFCDAERVLRHWTARTCLYEGERSVAVESLRKMEEHPEALLFLAEACIEEGLVREAEDALRRGIALCEQQESELVLHPGEILNWSTGSASIEDAAVGSGSGYVLIRHVMRVYLGYLLGTDDEPVRKQAGIEELYRLTRAERLSPIDPYNSLYSFLYMSILPETRDPGADDRVTVLGKAARYLQERISRIEAYDDRQAYIRDNLWNSRLVSESKRFNLV